MKMLLDRIRVSQTDWYSVYHRLLSQRGEDTEIGCWIYYEGKIIDKKTFDHQICDGHSALISEMKKHGFEEDEFPIQHDRSFRPDLGFYFSILCFLSDELVVLKSQKWEYQNPSPPFLRIGPAFRVFSYEKTLQIFKFSQQNGGQYPSMLLYVIHSAVSEVFLNKCDQTNWHIPISLRTWLKKENPYCNQLSNFVLKVRKEDTIASIHKRQKKYFRAFRHYVTLLFMGLGEIRLFKNFLNLKVYLDYRRPKASERITGTFSSMGNWPRKGNFDRLAGKMPIPYGNSSLKNPLCFLNICWNEHLIISLTAHSSICQSKDQVERVLSSIELKIEKLLNE